MKISWKWIEDFKLIDRLASFLNEIAKIFESNLNEQFTNEEGGGIELNFKL